MFKKLLLLILLIICWAHVSVAEQQNLDTAVPLDAWQGTGHRDTVLESGDIRVTLENNATKSQSNFTDLYGRVDDLEEGGAEVDPIFESWDKDYNDLINVPTIPTDNSELLNGAGYLTSESDPVFDAWDKDYNDLTNTPDIPTNNNELTNGAGYLDQSTADALYSAIGSGIWGNFTGTLSDQTDLQAELDRIALIEELLGASSFTMGALTDLLIKDSVQPDDGRALILDTVVEGSDDAALHVLSAEKVFDLVEYLDGRVVYLEGVVGDLEGGTPDPSAPTLESVVLSTSTDHEIATLTFSEAITQGTGYNDNQLDLDASIAGDDVALTYVSGDTTDTHVYTLGTTRVTSSEIVNFDFDGTTDSLEDSAGDDLAAITSATVTNNSSYAPAGSCEDLGDVNQPILASTGTISLGQYSNTGLAHAQYFVPDTNITLCGVAVQFKRPTGSGGTHSTTLTVKIYSDDGGTPKANRPDTLLYSSTTTIYQDDLTTSLAYYTFDFSDVSLTSGTAYWIYIDPTGYNATDYIQLSINSSSPTAQEFHVDWDGSAWTLAQYNAVSPIKIFGK